mgnify:CR=1 FL=1
MMTGTQINLGCGPVFVAHSDWVNLDFVARPFGGRCAATPT